MSPELQARLHPYPAMIPRDLASQLVARFLPQGGRLLDPFCGTGRTLAAAAGTAAEGVGFDVNPLAVLITRAKATRASHARLSKLLGGLASVTPCYRGRVPRPVAGAVRWFPPRAEGELYWLVEYLNTQKLRRHEVDLIAVLLSASARDASFIRRTGWKIHRMSADARQGFYVSPVEQFRRRLETLVSSGGWAGPALPIRCFVADARSLRAELARRHIAQPFDAVITSPPYGDSRTTVQYGGLTRLVWPILSQLEGLTLGGEGGAAVDARCLGAGRPRSNSNFCVDPYWRGAKDNPWRRNVESFLGDFAASLDQMGHCVRPGGYIVLVVARRRIGGHRQHIDRFCIDHLRTLGYTLEKAEERRITQKVIPYAVRADARREVTRQTRLSPTMRIEHILAFRRGVSTST